VLQILVEVAIIQAFILEVRRGVSFLDNRNSSRVSRSLASGVRTSQEGSGGTKGDWGVLPPSNSGSPQGGPYSPLPNR